MTENCNCPKMREKGMLILSRKTTEQIVAPDHDLVITVLAIEGNRVRLGIAAPDTVCISRKEVCGESADNPSPVSSN